MRTDQSSPLYSAKDLLNFLGCTHSTALDLLALQHLVAPPSDEDDAYLDLLKKKGIDHERAYLEQRRAEGRSLCEVPRLDSIDAMAAATSDAMRTGVDLIYQGALVSRPWHGYSDFLLRVDTPSALGAYSYEVADTKLARTAKPKHVLQLCLYSRLVGLVQELMPSTAHVVLGDGSTFSFRLEDYVHYCDAACERFLTFVGANERATTPEPCAHCDTCRWSDRCTAHWEHTDDLTLVARMSRTLARKLRADGVATLTQLARLPTDRRIDGVQPRTLENVREQALLQLGKRLTGENTIEVLPLQPRRGFARLPPPDDGDLFFDMEGDPLYSADSSLEYLFGFAYLENGNTRFKGFWALDRAGEKKAFEDAVDFIVDRLTQYPNAYVYHYAQYEETALRRLARQYGKSKRAQDDALKRLAQQHGTRENQVDDLLRNRKLVDLYKVVREGIRVSEDSYSLKNLEVFFAPERTQDIQEGNASIVAFERWLALGDDKILGQIEQYNEFDCRSTRLCRDWLLQSRPENVEWFDPAKEKVADDAEREQKRREDDTRIADIAARLIACADEDKPWCELLSHLLEYHRREARREWWEVFRRLDPGMSHDDFVEDADCIGCLTPHASIQPRPEKKSRIHTLTFPEQEIKLEEGDAVRADTREQLKIVKLDRDARILELKIGPTRKPLADVISLIPSGPVNDTIQRTAIERVAARVLDGNADRYAAVVSILRRDVPILDGCVILADASPDNLLAGTIDAICRMRSTHLVIQGPPGTGKTFTSAHAIVALLRAGKRVGVASFTHKAINNLLTKIETVATEQQVVFAGIKKNSQADHEHTGKYIVNTDDNDDVRDTTYRLVAGTAWLFARGELDQEFDYLFVEEAGQVSLASVVAMGTSAQNIVLVGDQMQLSQPVKGTHPGGSGASGLEYLMNGAATVPPHRGILLSRTWRMHPDLCAFISSAYYDGRLTPDASTARQKLVLRGDVDGALGESGLRFVPVDHTACSQRSDEEVARVNELYGALLGQQWIDQHGQLGVIGPADILVVTPYNMQVRALIDALPLGARVGTVDKFQGQEAAAVLISMASSDAEHAPRGMTFLFSRNRTNVAISRGRCLASVVASPTLLAAACSTVEQLRLANGLCFVRAYAKQDARPGRRPTLSS